jgi:chromosome segregation ATPase
MAEWMRPSSREPHDDIGVPFGGADAATATEAPVAERGGWLRRRPDEQVAALQAGQARVLDLIDSLQAHQRRQDTRAEEISRSLGEVARTLGSVEQSGRDQVERLTRIADELRAGQERWGQAASAIAELPRYAEAQQASLAAVAQQMDGLASRDGRMSDALDSLRQAVTALGDATTASSVAIKSLQMSALENQERVAELVQTQNRRFIWLFAVTLVLVVAVGAVGLVAWMGR